MTDEQIKKQIEVIEKTTKDILAQGPEACRKFLRDAGIIDSIYGECGKHPGNNLANCIHCKAESIQITFPNVNCENHIPVTFDSGETWRCIRCNKQIYPPLPSPPITQI